MSKIESSILRIAVGQIKSAHEQLLYTISATEIHELTKKMERVRSDIADKTRSGKRDVIVLVGIRK